MKYIKKRGEFEHRKKVEEFIGRKLNKEEVVHHINFNKEDNRICNLMLFANQKAHASFHIKFEKFGLNKQIRNQIAFRWKEYKNPIKEISIEEIEEYTGFTKPIWFEVMDSREVTNDGCNTFFSKMSLPLKSMTTFFFNKEVNI